MSPSNRLSRAMGSEFQNLFQVGKVLGSGTSSIVKLVTRKDTGQQFASKCVRCTDEEVQQFARDEYELLRRLRHPSIIKAFELFEEPGCSYICLEYCSGGSMQDYITTHGAMEGDRAVRLFFQILHGINYLHQRRVIHRDVKPDNLIFLNAEARIVKISDFNSATSLGKNGQGCRVMLSHRGTHLYSAPEMRFGRLWNERIDIWSCGLSFFFMLHGDLPFKEDQETNALLRAGRQPEVQWGNIALPIQQFLEQCFAVHFRDRPPALELLLHPIFRLLRPDVENAAGDTFVYLTTCGFLAIGLAGAAAKIMHLPPAPTWYRSPASSPIAAQASTPSMAGRDSRGTPIRPMASPVARLLRLMSSRPSGLLFGFGSDEEESVLCSASWPLAKKGHAPQASPSNQQSRSPFCETPGTGSTTPASSSIFSSPVTSFANQDLAKLKDYSQERSLRLLRKLAERKFERTMVPRTQQPSHTLRRPSSWCIEGCSDEVDADPLPEIQA